MEKYGHYLKISVEQINYYLSNDKTVQLTLTPPSSLPTDNPYHHFETQSARL